MPPSLVAVKAFQQTAEKQQASSRGGEMCLTVCREREGKMLASARNNKEDGDQLAAPNHLSAFTNEQDCVCHEEFVFS